MNRQDLERWAEEHHHPQLVLTDNDIVKSGPFAWKRLLSDTSGRIDQALARISAFVERVEREKRGMR